MWSMPGMPGLASRRRFLAGTGLAALGLGSGLSPPAAATDPGSDSEWLSVADFGALGNGISDDGPALRSCGDYMRAAGVRGCLYTVHFPTGNYLVSDGFALANISRLRIAGNGSTLKNITGFIPGLNHPTLLLGRQSAWKIPGSVSDLNDHQGTADGGYLLAAATSPTSVTVSLSPTDVGGTDINGRAKWLVGDLALIYGRAGQDNGYPPNPQQFRFAYVTAVNATSGTLTLDRAVGESFDPARFTTRGFYAQGAGGSLVPGGYGPARIVNLTARLFSDYIEVNDLEILGKSPTSPYTDDHGVLQASAYEVVCNDLSGFMISANVAASVTFNNVDQVLLEMDKVVESWVMRDCTFRDRAGVGSDGFLGVGNGIMSLDASSVTVNNQIMALRPRRQVWRNCRLRLGSNAATNYLDPYSHGGRIELDGVELVANGAANSIQHAGLFAANRRYFGTSFAVTNSGGTTVKVTLAGITAIADEMRYPPGMPFVAWNAVHTGLVYGVIQAHKVNGGNLDLYVGTTGAMLANGEVMAAWPLSEVVIRNTTMTGRSGGSWRADNLTINEYAFTRTGIVLDYVADVFNRKFIPIGFPHQLARITLGVSTPYLGLSIPAWLVGMMEYWRADGSSGTGWARWDLAATGTRSWTGTSFPQILGLDVTPYVTSPAFFVGQSFDTHNGMLLGDATHLPNLGLMPTVNVRIEAVPLSMSLFPSV